jgi:hypothetical protein
MTASFHPWFGCLLKSAVVATAIAFCVVVTPHDAAADSVVYNFVQYEPGLYPFTVTGDIEVNSGSLVGGGLSFDNQAAIPFSAWYQPSWNGSYLTAGLFNTAEGTVLATGPGQPEVQVFNSLSDGTTVVGSWMEVPEPTVLSMLLLAGSGLGAVARRSRRVSV